jgi:bacillolysin/neutral peptidase B
MPTSLIRPLPAAAVQEVWGLAAVKADTSQFTGGQTTLVRFVQTARSIPIFGSRAVVELDRDNDLVAVDASLADVQGVPHITALSATEALRRIADHSGAKIEQLQNVNAPELTFFHDDEKEKWHLAWFFESVPAAPADFAQGLKSHGVGRSPGQWHPELDYLVDAHDGTILLYWSSAPTAAEVPVSLKGKDEYSEQQEFYGRDLKEGGPYELYDPMRRIKTFDFGGRHIGSQELPTSPISSPQSELSDMPGAVSAHFHATRVDDFLRSVLARNGIDNKGMELVSFVNCISLDDGPGPEWRNAAWWKQRMWYGQAKENGKLRSFSRFLDVIAHELAHGITETTANLAYVRQRRLERII